MEQLESLVTPPPPGARIFRGLIGEDAASPNSSISVRVPAYHASRSFGPCYFAPRPLQDGSLLLPQRNDPCLVALDENEEAELLSWWAADPTSEAGRVTQSEHDALVSRVSALEAGLPTNVAVSSGTSVDISVPASANFAILDFELEYPSTQLLVLQPNGDASVLVTDRTFTSSTVGPNAINNPPTASQNTTAAGLLMASNFGSSGNIRVIGNARVITRSGYSGRRIMESTVSYTNVIGSGNVYIVNMRAAATFNVSPLTFLRFALTVGSGPFSNGIIQARFI